jgi:hypothetical protein
MIPEQIAIGQIADLRIGFVTREVERLSEDEFAVHTITDGWQTEYMNLQTLKRYINERINE